MAHAEEKTTVHRGIVVTHGVGSQRRADQLDTVVEPLMTFLCRALVPRMSNSWRAHSRATICWP